MGNDLISREALLKYTMRMTEYDESGCGVPVLVVRTDDIEKVPAVDAVEVVRCVNCVWYCEWRTKPGVFLCGRPNNGGLVVKPDFFCKHGERKEVENGKSN